MIKNRFDCEEAEGMDELEMRVYTSLLLGADQDLVLHGGGNTSVKIGDLLYVKGSGWDLGSIEKEGFSPTEMGALLALLKHDTLSDSEMVRAQQEALADRGAPAPSIEAILHALIPYRFVDHTHADAIVTISNTVKGEELIESLYGENYLIVPYVMPGFELAKVIDRMTRDIDWGKLEGMILHHHGIFTFSDDPQSSYDKMIESVARAEAYLERNAALEIGATDEKEPFDMEVLQRLLSEAKGYEVVLRLNRSPLARYFASQNDMQLYQKGVLTPEHIIRTKRFPVVFDRDPERELQSYIKNYEEYFARYATHETMLDPAPNWAVIRGIGTLSIGKSEKEAKIIEDITTHTMKAIVQGERLGGYRSIDETESFAMEYWELEQMKLKG